MVKVVVRRLAQLVPILFGLSILAFAVGSGSSWRSAAALLAGAKPGSGTV